MKNKLRNLLLLILLSILIVGQFEKLTFNNKTDFNEVTVSSIDRILDLDATHFTTHSHLSIKNKNKNQGQDDSYLPLLFMFVPIISFSQYQPNEFSHKTKMAGFFSARKYESNYLS
ncbi:hypothetical protein J22TS1_09390 [Siminovitchia terrae]|uniref:hypothetical protein n=1 Tax=Siminovitchia terrae TaxID=1914933 RepID=UPI001AFF7E76|nr:hypothetical protein [Siminovitchia terrae]GIN89888.1 hypothetical protein J22TS1_09390 [Siminovitchia terrae]